MIIIVKRSPANMFPILNSMGQLSLFWCATQRADVTQANCQLPPEKQTEARYIGIFSRFTIIIITRAKNLEMAFMVEKVSWFVCLSVVQSALDPGSFVSFACMPRKQFNNNSNLVDFKLDSRLINYNHHHAYPLPFNRS